MKAKTPKRKIPLKYRLNPCDIDHYEALLPAQRFFELFSKGTDCKCCLGARVVIGFAAGIALGFIAGIIAG